jgi:pimeloyl-ACP methyl ester carboxylesterase
VGTSPVSACDPDLWTDEYAFLSRPGQSDIQMELFHAYRTNVAICPPWQKWLRRDSRRASCCGVASTRRSRSRKLMRSGASVSNAEVHILDAGHFALDEEPDTVARLTRSFLASVAR